MTQSLMLLETVKHYMISLEYQAQQLVSSKLKELKMSDIFILLV